MTLRSPSNDLHKCPLRSVFKSTNYTSIFNYSRCFKFIYDCLTDLKRSYSPTRFLMHLLVF